MNLWREIWLALSTCVDDIRCAVWRRFVYQPPPPPRVYHTKAISLGIKPAPPLVLDDDYE